MFQRLSRKGPQLIAGLGRQLSSMNDPLPNEAQRKLFTEFMADAFICIRLIAGTGHAEQASGLADVFHNVGKETYGWGSWSWSRFRGMVENYSIKYAGTRNSCQGFITRIDEIREST